VRSASRAPLDVQQLTGRQDVVVANHPSFLVVPGEVEPINKPTQVNVGDKDAMFSVDQADQTRDILSKKGVKSEVNICASAASSALALRPDVAQSPAPCTASRALPPAPASRPGL
jgi:hypothetical protein